eukprot:3405255-Pyramimonas_sp.AAC.1
MVNETGSHAAEPLTTLTVSGDRAGSALSVSRRAAMGDYLLAAPTSMRKCGYANGYAPSPLVRLVLTLGIHSLPSFDWFSRW